MPSGAKKRKAAKKKKVHDSSTSNPHQGENDIQDPPSTEKEVVEVEKRGYNSSENKSKDATEAEGNIEVEIGSKSKSSHGSSSSSSDSSDDESSLVEKQVVVLESVPVIESLPEKISPIVDPVKPVESSLEEVSRVYDETKNEERHDLVVEEQTVVVSEIGLKDDCQTSSLVVESVSKENGAVELLPSFNEKASLESKDYVASSTSANGSISEVNGADCASETHTIEHSDSQPPAASVPLAVQKTTSWKSCCGIFDLFSGSER